MNAKRAFYLAALAVCVGITVNSLRTAKRQRTAQEVARPQATAKQFPSPPPPPADTPRSKETPPAEQAVPAPPVQPPDAGGVATRRATAPANPPGAANAPGDQDPTAREALSYVGADPAATAYWVSAINNPDLSAHERQNLIEDLNEDGLSDPRNPGPEDLPLILSRLRLIEQLAPSAMDQVNADAFAEARKDLVNMVNDLTGQ
jgi:type IV secretory pathway VirB10-like protein